MVNEIERGSNSSSVVWLARCADIVSSCGLRTLCVLSLGCVHLPTVLGHHDLYVHFGFVFASCTSIFSFKCKCPKNCVFNVTFCVYFSSELGQEAANLTSF